VYGLTIEDASDTVRYAWYRSPLVLGMIALALGLSGYIVLALL
jgi:hypothetical protein